jgi:hypothetical protein
MMKLPKPIKEAFMQYISLGLCPIPIGQEKMPLVPWKEFQERFPTEKEVCQWIAKYPTLNVGIVTGAISNLVVLDIDSDAGKEVMDNYLPDTLQTPTVKTKKGTHYYFRPPEGKKIQNKHRFKTDCDIKGDGGYVLAPPSINYQWLIDLSTTIAVFPPNLLTFVDGYSRRQLSTSIPNPQSATVNLPVDLDLSAGHRDDSLYHMAVVMKRGGASEGEANKVLCALADKCAPPFAHTDALDKVKSAYHGGLPSERSQAGEVKTWVQETVGIFSVADCDRELCLIAPTQKNNRKIILHRMLKDGIIERIGKKEGYYRRIIRSEEQIAWQNADLSKKMQVKLPFAIEDYCQLYPGNIIVVAGSPNSGKSALLLNIARMNLMNNKIIYFSSEMNAEELHLRLSKFECPLSDWGKVDFRDRSSNFADVLEPGCINVIDYLEMTNDIYLIGEELKKIHDKIKTGLTFVAIQKKFGQELGRGQEFSLEKPRLYLSIEKGELKIIKAKNWASDENPNGKIFKFNLVNGCQFLEKNETFCSRNF